MFETVIYFVLLISLVSLLGYCYGRYSLTYWRRRNVPECPDKNFFYGNFGDVFKMRMSAPRLLGKYHLEAKRNEPFLGIYFLQKPGLLVRDAELIRQMFVKDFHVFSDRVFGATSDPIMSKNLFSMNNPEWKYLRTKLSPIFTSGKLKKLFLLIVESSKLMSKYLEREFEGVDEKITLEVREVANKYTSNNISSLAFGVAINCFETPAPEFYLRGVGVSKITLLRGMRYISQFFMPSFEKVIGGNIFAEHEKFYEKVFWDSMKHRQKENFKRGDLIDSLIELKNEEQDAVFKFEGDSLFAQAALFFLAGKETSNSTITFALQELAKRPEMQDKLRKEIREKLAGGITYEALSSMKYLYQVINETLRLNAPAPILDRITKEDYKIPNSNVTIEAGTPIYISLDGLHLDPRYHPNPEQFDPERFSDERKSEMLPCTYMPFGDGPRICIAMRLGLLQTAVGIVSVLRDYEVFINPKYKNEINVLSVFIQMKNGLWLDLRKIKQ